MKVELKNILGPSQVIWATGIPIKDDKDYLVAQERYLSQQRRGGLKCFAHDADSNEKAVAYVNEGRLLIDCSCLNGVVVDVQAELACCFWCGKIWRGAQLVLPTQVDIEEIDLLFDKMATQDREFHPMKKPLEQLRLEKR